MSKVGSSKSKKGKDYKEKETCETVVCVCYGL